MSKSLDYTMKYASDKYNKDTIVEKMASPYMDWVMKGERELVKETVCGIIKSVVDFDENGNFNFLNFWSGELDSPYSEELLEEQILYTVDDQLNGNLQVPLQEDGKPLGGDPENGDTIHITFGNYIIDVKDKTDTSCYISVALPMRYELIKRPT